MAVLGRAPTARTRWIAGVVVALSAVALAVAVRHLPGRADQPRPAAPSLPATPVVLNGTDIAFIHLIIAMDEGALAVVDLLEARSGDVDPRLRAVADRLRAAHRTEVRELRSLLAAADVAEENPHEGHEMPGMVTGTNLAGLRAAPPAETGPQAVTLIRAHLAQTVVLCDGALASGANPELRTLAARMRRDRTAELAALDALVAAGGGAGSAASVRSGGVATSPE